MREINLEEIDPVGCCWRGYSLAPPIIYNNIDIKTAAKLPKHFILMLLVVVL